MCDLLLCLVSITLESRSSSASTVQVSQAGYTALLPASIYLCIYSCSFGGLVCLALATLGVQHCSWRLDPKSWLLPEAAVHMGAGINRASALSHCADASLLHLVDAGGRATAPDASACSGC